MTTQIRIQRMKSGDVQAMDLVGISEHVYNGSEINDVELLKWVKGGNLNINPLFLTIIPINMRPRSISICNYQSLL